MPVRRATATWQGTLKRGSGAMRFGDGAFEGAYSAGSRFEEAAGTNPEALIGAAHAGCFSMAFAGVLEEAGHPPERIDSEARVHLNRAGKGFRIERIELHTRARVPGIDAETFAREAERAKNGCPVSQALAGVAIELRAELEGN